MKTSNFPSLLILKKNISSLFVVILLFSFNNVLALNLGLPVRLNFNIDSTCKVPFCIPYSITKTVSTSNCINCLQLQPNKTFSKEATISSYIPNENRSSSILDVGGVTQTNNGSPNITRTLLDFDLSSIPEGTEIKKAELYLYGHQGTTIGANMPPNDLEIYRITSNWNQNTVTWNNQPTFDTGTKVKLSSSTEDFENYVVDVTVLVENYLNNKSNSFGFILKLTNETPYRRLIFASSKTNNPQLYPKLIVYKK